MQNIRSITFAVVAVMITGFSLVAIAATPVPSGWYIEANAGKSSSSESFNNASTSDNGLFGFNLDAGYKFMPYFGAEVGYTKYHDVKVKSGGNNIASDSHNAADAAVKAMLPMPDWGFELFTKLGIAQVHSNLSINDKVTANKLGITESSSNKNGYYIAVGGDYSFMPNLAANVQWSRAKGHDEYDLFSVGVNFILG